MVKRRAHSEPDRETNEDQGHNVGNRSGHRLTRPEAPAYCKAASGWRPLSLPASASSLAARGPVVRSNLAGAMSLVQRATARARGLAAPAMNSQGRVRRTDPAVMLHPQSEAIYFLAFAEPHQAAIVKAPRRAL
jgi:hypothetical protein